MLVLKRKLGESIMIYYENGDAAEIVLSEVDKRNGSVKLAFIADNKFNIVRKEIDNKISDENKRNKYDLKSINKIKYFNKKNSDNFSEVKNYNNGYDNKKEFKPKIIIKRKKLINDNFRNEISNYYSGFGSKIK